MKKILIFILALVLAGATLGLTACNNRDKDTIVIWAYDASVTAAQEAVKLYKKNNPNAKFEVVELAQDDLVQKFRIALASGSAVNLPDIIYEEDYNTIGYLKYYNSFFVDLTDYIDPSTFVPYKINNVTYNGKIYGVPYDSSAAPLFYRLDYLEQAGFTEADMEGITWEEFVAIGLEVKRVTGKLMVTICPEGNIEGRVMLQSASRWYYDLDGNLDIVGNIGLERMMETMKLLNDSGIAYRATGWDDIISSFYNGNVASIIGGTWWAPIIAENPSQSGLWRIAKLPRMSGDDSFTHYSMIGGGAWYVMNKPNKDKSISFLTQTIATSLELANIMVEKKQVVPTLLNAINCENAQKGDPYFGGQRICEIVGEWGVLTPLVNYGEFPYEIAYKQGELMTSYLDGTKTVQQVLQELQDYAEAL